MGRPVVIVKIQKPVINSSPPTTAKYMTFTHLAKRQLSILPILLQQMIE